MQTQPDRDRPLTRLPPHRGGRQLRDAAPLAKVSCITEPVFALDGATLTNRTS